MITHIHAVVYRTKTNIVVRTLCVLRMSDFLASVFLSVRKAMVGDMPRRDIRVREEGSASAEGSA
jgi:hypothetical protein